ncbi:BREX-1 system adenine-specific DNA-methyltransferase PglX [Megasphaera elsdenii]|uniref:BREX-1 system adenine-specific DNA-methyltransferase PglX n=1 Tax=Megasphaera elsdenii TaxID=907 RepID=UPI00242ED4C4|nr:BREX-1 system adenine-specific DNA-methyltransferase PglX [Megasphaera elsdenii]
MNKTAIRNFATWARVTLQEAMRQRAGLLGITPSDIKEPLPASTPEIQYFDLGTGTPVSIEGPGIRVRKKLTERLLQDHDIDYGTAYRTLIENMASTWFNRLIAIRYMEVNDYFPDHIRTLSSDVSGKVDPDLVSTPFDSDLEFTTAEKQQILDWKDANQNDELFNFLLLKRCHQIGQWMPDFFEGDDDASDFFLQFSYIDPNGVVYHLVHDLPEDDFQDQVQIIGWLYQYYNSELKDEVFANLKKNVKVTKENIPAATQLFTPDWIVRYMVENSLGRLWLAGHPDDALQAKWKYYVPDAPQDASVTAELDTLKADYAKLQPEDLSLIDCCSGSGHILAYAFDVLMDIYDSQGYTPREAAQSILEHNLYGLDIDDRAWQLTYFSLMMKARQYDRRLFSRDLRPQVCAIEESNGLTKWSDMRGQVEAEQMTLEEQFVNLADELIDTFHDAKNYGSLLQVAPANYDGLLDYMQQLLNEGCNNLFLSGWLQEVAERMPQLIRQVKLLSRKYWVCVTNPPYLGAGNFNAALNKFSRKYFPDSKADFFAIFMERCNLFVKKNGFQSMITQHSWMFLARFEKLRFKVQQKTIVNMAHLGPRAFEEIGGEVVQTTSFVLLNYHIHDYLGTYCRLTDPMTQRGKENLFLSKDRRYTAKVEDFARIPGKPIAYWISENMISKFDGAMLGKILTTREGMATADNDRFLRQWFEVDYYRIGYNFKNIDEAVKSCKKWFPYNKGGEYRKWYGNHDYVVNWENNGYEIKNNVDLKTGRIRSHNYNGEFAFKKGITWSALSVSRISVRFVNQGFLFDSKGARGFTKNDDDTYYALGLINSVVGAKYLSFIAPTVDFKVGDIRFH